MVHIIGTGSGKLSVPAGVVPGDTIAINPGTYTYANFSNLSGVTIQNNGGLVTFSPSDGVAADNWSGNIDFGNNKNVTLIGNGAAGIKNGFRFLNQSFYGGCIVVTPGNDGCVISNFDVINCNNDFIGNTNQGAYQYDGTTSSMVMHNCKVTNINSVNSAGIFENYKGYFTNIIYGCEFSFITMSGCTTDTPINAVGIYKTSLHDWSVYDSAGPGADDVGLFFIQGGSVQIYNNYVVGKRWGWLTRIQQACLNTQDDSHVYNNIVVGSLCYGLMDFQQAGGSTGVFASAINVPGGNTTLVPGDVYIENNTCGDFANSDNYVTPVALIYNSGGKQAYVRNNLRFNSGVGASNGGVVAKNVYFFSTTPPDPTPIEQGDLYVATYNLAVTDEVSFEPFAGSPVINSGVGPYVATDFYGKPRTNKDIGAVAYVEKTGGGTTAPPSGGTVTPPPVVTPCPPCPPCPECPPIPAQRTIVSTVVTFSDGTTQTLH